MTDEENLTDEAIIHSISNPRVPKDFDSDEDGAYESNNMSWNEAKNIKYIF